MLRNLLIFSALAAAAASSASFDMLLLPSQEGRVYRYDPLNRVAFGSYSTASVPMIAATSANGIAYSGSTTGSGIRANYYSTGELYGIYNGTASAKSIDITSTNVFQITSSVLRRVNLANGSATSYLFSNTITGMTTCVYGNYLHVFGINASNQIQYQTFDLTTLTFGAVTNTSLTVGAGTTLGKAGITVNPVNGKVGVLFTYLSGGSLLGGYSDVQSTGQNINTTFTSYNYNTLAFSTAVGMPAFVGGHSGFWLVGQDTTDTTKTRITRFDLFSAPLFNDSHVMTAPSAGYNPAVSAYVPANVIAPEPAEFLALGVGLAGLILKKRRKKDS